MPYEKLQLVIAGLSGEIYLAKLNKSGFMGESRKIMTQDCLRASTEWFMSNKKKMVSYEELPTGEKPHLFYTNDKQKAKKILEILNES